MSHSVNFNEEIHPISLRFVNQKLENKYREKKELEISGCTPKVLLGVFMFLSTLTCLLYMLLHSSFDRNENQGYLAVALVGTLPIGLEIIIHILSPLRYFRMFFATLSICMTAVMASAYTLSTPGILLIGIPNFLISFFGNIYYGYNWISSLIAHLMCQIVVTVYLYFAYYSVIDVFALSYYMCAYNLAAVFIPWICYLYEKKAREIWYLHWENEKDLKFWKKLVRVLPLGLVVANENKISHVNKFTAELFGSKLKGKEKLKYMSETFKRTFKQNEEDKNLYDVLLNLPENNQAVNGKFAFSDSLHISASIFNFKRAGKKFSICIIQNEKLIEELEQERIRNKFQKNFFAMMTHELRNPLNGIMGVLDIIKCSSNNEEILQYCKIGVNTGKLMMCLVNDILDLSQLEANKLTLIEEIQDFNLAACECIEIFKSQYEQKGLQLMIKRNDTIPLICNDKRRYSQIVINLLSNAIKFTKKGGVTIELDYSLDKNELITSVTDTGSGIKEGDIDKLFGLYGKLEGKKENPNGIGLGLLICKRLAEQMGGSINVKSTVNVGTTFTFAIKNRSDIVVKSKEIIPKSIENSEQKCEIVMKKQDWVNTNVTSTSKVLIIDDDYSSRFVLSSVCNNLQATADSACCGEEGVELVERRSKLSKKEENYKLFFVDMHMPGISGLETAEKIVGFYKNLSINFTIIGLSGDSDEELRNECKKCGMSELLVKPFSKEDIKRIIEKYT